MTKTTVDHARFRLRAFETEWVEPLSENLVSPDRRFPMAPVGLPPWARRDRALLRYVLLAEADSWISVGQHIGYFADAPVASGASEAAESWDWKWLSEVADVAPSSRWEWVLDAIRSRKEASSGLEIADFARALSAARDALTSSRRELLCSRAAPSGIAG
jgi:hypothetical protein